MMPKPETSPPQTISIRLVDIDKKFIEPYTIQDKFVSLVAFHYADREQVIGGKTIRQTVRVPIMLIWDGTNISYTAIEVDREIEVAGEKYLIDREVDEYPCLPSSKFVLELTKNIEKMMAEFDPKVYFQMVQDYYEYYFYLPHPMLRKLISLFCVNQMVFDAHDSTPYLYIRAPDKSCGKSHLGQSIISMTNGMMTTNPKEHHVFRMTHSAKMSLGFDEIKGWTGKNANDKENQDLMSLINTGFQRGGSKVPRMGEKMVNGQKTWVVELFDGYTPKVFITTQMTLPEDTMSRCVEIMMQKANSGDGEIDYAERWGEPERVAKLEKIREMGYLFRLKYGMELKSLGADREWRQKLDIKNTFCMVKNRERQIYGPLILLCLKFIPEWQDDVAHYIKKNMEMRNHLEPSTVVAVLYALRDIWQRVESGDRSDDRIIFKNDVENGRTIYVPVDSIVCQIKSSSDMVYLGKNENATVGKTLRDLGFLKSERQSYGMRRIICGEDLHDRCLRYIGKGLGSDMSGGGLSQVEKISEVRTILLDKNNPRDGIVFDELLLKLNGKMTSEELRNYLKQMKVDGCVAINGKGEIRWFDP